MQMREIMAASPIIPVLTIEDPAEGVELCSAILAGGLKVIEITLRTEKALKAIEAVATAHNSAIVGVGTVLDPLDFARARDAGAVFSVSPGLHPDMVAAASKAGINYLPGIQTASEAYLGLSLGLDALKFFPAEAAGGPNALKQLGPVYPGLHFCPTGGLTMERAKDYLALANVPCAGGSMVTPADLVAAKDWAAIETLSRTAAALGQ